MMLASIDISLNSGSTPALHDLERASGPLEVVPSDAMTDVVARGHAFVERCLRDGRAVYGATTGFGPLVGFAGRDEAADQCDNALQHLTVGQGPDLPAEIVRAAVLVRLYSLARGRSGVAPAVIDGLCAMLRTTFTPAVPVFGSVGASGDLVPLAHVAQSLRGVGHAYVDGIRLPAAVALRRAGLVPLPLAGRDALALVNGTSVTTAAAGLAVVSLRRSQEVAVALSALLCDLLGARPRFAEPELLSAYGHPEASWVGERLSWWLSGGSGSPERPLQEPYSIRCVPQLLGAVASALGWATGVIERDLAGISDNPLFFAEHDLVAHGGNFFGQPAAFAADLMSTVATQTGNLAERQLDLMVDPHRNGGRPPMLSPRPGKQHAVQGVQVLATSLVVAMRRRCVPAGMQSVPTNLHNQDVVPFGTQAAISAFEQAATLRLLHGCLAVALRQAAHVGRAPTAPRCAELLTALASTIEPVDPDRPLDEDIRKAANIVDGRVAALGPT